MCIPPNITVEEHKASVSLQDLVDHTAMRLITCNKEVFQSEHVKGDEIELVSKVGFDGAGNQSQYSQLWMDTEASDKTIMLTAWVPLLMHQNLDANGGFKV